MLDAIGPLGPQVHFVYASSIAANDGRAAPHSPMTESVDPGRPYHVYGRKKLATERHLIQEGIRTGFALSIIRVCGVFGLGSIEKGLYSSLKRLVLNRSPLTRLNWPGKISSMHVDDMAYVIEQVSRSKPPPGEHRLYIPSTDAYTVQQLCEAYYRAAGLPYDAIGCPASFWKAVEWVTGHKRFWEFILPHRLYNKVWQANILVSQGYWNKSETLKSLLGSRRLKTFEEHCAECAQEPSPGLIACHP